MPVAEAWPDELGFVQQPAAQLPWTHVTTLLDRLTSPDERAWYAEKSAEHGWSRAVLEHQIATRLHQRIGAAPLNFADHLPAADSDLARELVKDPYVFDHLGLTERVDERTLEQAMMDRLQETLLEFERVHALFVVRQDRQLAQRLDVCQEVLAARLAQDPAQQPTEKADVVAQRIGHVMVGETAPSVLWGVLGKHRVETRASAREPDSATRVRSTGGIDHPSRWPRVPCGYPSGHRPHHLEPDRLLEPVPTRTTAVA